MGWNEDGEIELLRIEIREWEQSAGKAAFLIERLEAEIKQLRIKNRQLAETIATRLLDKEKAALRARIKELEDKAVGPWMLGI